MDPASFRVFDNGTGKMDVEDMPTQNGISKQVLPAITDEIHETVCWWPAPAFASLFTRLEPISLEQMASVALLNRVETKFVFHERQLDAILESLAGSYRVMEVNGNRLNHYRTLYFDTDDFSLFQRQHAGGRNRYKVRSRAYLDSDLSFLEVKRKVKGNRTEKSRMKTAGFVDRLYPEVDGFLTANLPRQVGRLKPKLWNDYTRITLVAINQTERVTLDIDLKFQAGERTVVLPGIVIAEVKKIGRDLDSEYIRLMKARTIRSTGFSKYCIGVSMLYPEIKHNRFKPKLRRIGRLIHGEQCYV